MSEEQRSHVKFSPFSTKFSKCSSAVATMQWSKGADSGAVPGARSSHALAAIDDILYLNGGELVARTPLPGDLFAYDMKRRCWRRCELSGCVMGPRLGHSMTAVGKDLFVFGGRTGVHFADSTLGDMFKIDTETMECSEVHAAGIVPQPRSYHAAASSSDSNLYMFGGCGAEGRLNDLHCYNAKTHVWQALPTSPDIKV